MFKPNYMTEECHVEPFKRNKGWDVFVGYDRESEPVYIGTFNNNPIDIGFALSIKKGVLIFVKPKQKEIRHELPIEPKIELGSRFKCMLPEETYNAAMFNFVHSSPKIKCTLKMERLDSVFIRFTQIDEKVLEQQPEIKFEGRKAWPEDYALKKEIKKKDLIQLAEQQQLQIEGRMTIKSRKAEKKKATTSLDLFLF
jgi:hypothetical protein